MMQSKHTKRAFLASILSMMLCMAMLIGSTFAWFTDSVTSGKNIIKAGNLDISATYQNVDMQNGTAEYTISGFDRVAGGTVKFAAATTDINKDNAIITEDIWEPGAVGAKLITVTNSGNLAAKIKLNFAVNDGGLQDALWFDFVKVENGAVTGQFTEREMNTLTAFSSATELPLASESNISFILLYGMKEEAGNEYMGKSFEADVTILATQDTVESDSFGTDYDANATFPDVVYARPSSQQEIESILSNPTTSSGEPAKAVVLELSDGTYTLPAVTGDKKVTISGGANTVIDMKNSGIIGAQNAGLDLTIEGVKVEFASENYKGITHSEKVTYKDCTITGKQFLYANDAKFINCKLVQDAVDYNVWTYGAGTVLFDGCEFSCKGKSVLIYNEGATEKQTVEFRNCKFNASATATGKAAIEIDSYGTSYDVIIDQATADNVIGFATGSVSGNSVWNVKNKVKPVKVTVNGSVVYNQ